MNINKPLQHIKKSQGGLLVCGIIKDGNFGMTVNCGALGAVCVCLPLPLLGLSRFLKEFLCDVLEVLEVVGPSTRRSLRKASSKESTANGLFDA